MIESLRGTFDKARFILRHDTIPEIVSEARELLIMNSRCLEGLFEKGLVTEERLAEIEQDEGLQSTYISFMERSQEGGEAAKEVSWKLLLIPLDEFGGWLEYQRRFYEKHWSLKLISPEDW